MSEINKEAFKKAEQELLDKKVNEVKGYILETLEKIEQKKKDKEKIEEELRILKLDLEDFRNGKFDKIEERINKSKLARQVSVNFTGFHPPFTGDWLNWTSGTYPTNSGTIFYF